MAARGRVMARLACGVAAFTFVHTGPGAAADDAPPPEGGATAGASAERGASEQVLPVEPPPPAPTIRCDPGALIRGVDVGSQKVIAFSFDDGPWPTYTDRVMDHFEARGLRATFFMIGVNVASYPAIARSVADRGFEIGNHSQTHRYSTSRITAEIPVANDTIERATGVRPVLFRSPGLTMGANIQQGLADAGMCNVFTTVVLNDSVTPRKSSSYLCSRFANTLHPGEIVLLHDGGTHANTVNALPCMLDWALGHGYEIVTVGQLTARGTPYSGPRPRTESVRPPLTATTTE